MSSGLVAAISRTRPRRYHRCGAFFRAQAHNIFIFARLSCLTAAVLLICGGSICRAQSNPDRGPISPPQSGVWFQIKGAIKGEPRAGQGGQTDKRRASVTVKLRISSHAVGSNYYGEIAQSFADFDLAEGAPEKIYWQDTACHPRRGLPRVFVTAVDGKIHGQNRDVEIKARPRQIGVPLPKDEISAASALRRGEEKGQNFLAFQVRTGASKLDIVVRIYTVDCSL